MRTSRYVAFALVLLVSLVMVLPGSTLVAARGTSPAGGPSHPGLAATPRVPTQLPASPPGLAPRAPLAGPSVSVPVPLAYYPNTCLETPNATPVSGHITPCLLTTPVPMGLSDLGVASSGAAYGYATASFTANVTIRSLAAFSPGYAAFGNAPNWVRIALDAVAVNATYPRETVPGTFWVANGAAFNGTELVLEDNVWNFSGEKLPVRAGTLTGTAGTIEASEYYGGIGPSFSIASVADYPLYLHLTSSIANVTGHVVISLNYSLTEATTVVGSGTYDTVTFSALALGASPPSFRVQGKAYNPAGLLDDVELDLSGQGDGANANLQQLNASVRLDRWNPSTLKFEPTPSAYDFGEDAGETAQGVAAYYLNTTGNRTENLGPGPSLLRGFWNTSANTFVTSVLQGWTHLTVQVQPSYAFLFEANHTGLLPGVANLSYVPTTPSGLVSMFLPPLPAAGEYVFDAWADGYVNSTPAGGAVFSNNTTVSKTISLVASPSVENAPVYLDGDSQVGVFGGAGVAYTGYSASAMTLWLNASTSALAAPFLRINDFEYPTFVLFAAEGLSYSVLINGFHQDPLSFGFTEYGGTVVNLINWTQGYYFFGGSGAPLDSVGNITVEGNSALAHAQNPTLPPSTIECYYTPVCRAENDLATVDATGLRAIHAGSVTLGTLTATTGATAAVIENSTNVVAHTIAAAGADGTFSSGGVSLLFDSIVNITGLSATNLAWSILSNGTRGLSVTGLSETVNSPGFFLNYTNSSALRNVVVDNTSTGGTWSNSTGLSLTNLTSAGTGVAFFADKVVTVVGANAMGVGATAIQQFDNSTGGRFSYINATDIALGVNLTYASNVTLSNIVAKDGSVGANLTNVSVLTATGLTATNTSVALTWQPITNGTNGGSSGTISNVQVASGPASAKGANGTGSPGLNITYVAGLTISNVTATGIPGLSATMFSTALGYGFGVIAVNLTHDTNVQLTNLRTYEYPSSISVSHGTTLAITDVVSWYGNLTLNLTNSTSVTVTHLFAYGGKTGAVLDYNLSAVSISGSMFEGLLQAGINITFNSTANALGASITANNFIASNGSGESGRYSAAHAQIVTSNTSGTLTFSGNYFADHSGGGGYAIPDGAHDASPASAVLLTWLEFDESGLPSGTNWSFQYGGVTYWSVVPSVFIPGWALGLQPVTFSVASAGGLKPSPGGGTLTWTGTNQTVEIHFGTGLPFGLTLFELIGLVGAIVAAVVGLVLWRLLRRPSARGDPLDEEGPAAVRRPTPSSGDRHRRRYEP